jgi:hypothetical protein
MMQRCCCGGSGGLLLLVAVLCGTRPVLSRASPNNYTILNNTDFFGYNAGSKHAATFEECAEACWAHVSCMAASWNGPNSAIHDLNCNFHCSTAGKRADKGELAAVIRADKTHCPDAPPPPPPKPKPAPPVPIPPAWIAREQQANMYYDKASAVPLVVGNGFTAAMTHTGTMHVGACVSIYLLSVETRAGGAD